MSVRRRRRCRTIPIIFRYDEWFDLGWYQFRNNTTQHTTNTWTCYIKDRSKE